MFLITSLISIDVGGDEGFDAGGDTLGACVEHSLLAVKESVR